uniref:Uncharacterized protein n=1 Tax=Cyprinus carpio carpio TaxID=630221 RepID=A0A9J8CBU2_CYPCA
YFLLVFPFLVLIVNSHYSLDCSLISYLFCRFLYTTSTLIVALSIKGKDRLKTVGGILFLMTNMQVGNLFDSHRSTIITVYNGAFDSSSAIFLIIKVLCERRVSLRSSFLFLSHLIWLSVMHLRHYFIGTLNPMLNRLFCGVLCALWNGLLMDRHKRKPLDPGVSEREADLCSSVLSLLLTSLQCLLFSICASVPFLPLQYVTFILQVLNHSFLNGGNAEPFYVNLCFPIHYKELLYIQILDILITFYLNFDSYAIFKTFIS